MRKTLQRVRRIGGTVVVALVLLLVIALAGVRLFGLDIYMVLSGSMEPTYSTGTLLYVKKADPSALTVGDVITFRVSGSAPVTHRIVEESTPENAAARVFRTQGDANETADAAPVSQEQILGKPVFAIPYLGYFAAWLQSTTGKLVVLGLVVVLAVGLLLPELLAPSKKTEGRP